LSLYAENGSALGAFRQRKLRTYIFGVYSAEVIAEPPAKTFIVEVELLLGFLPELL
jgi:hypothetical protein